MNNFLRIIEESAEEETRNIVSRKLKLPSPPTLTSNANLKKIDPTGGAKFTSLFPSLRAGANGAELLSLKIDVKDQAEGVERIRNAKLQNKVKLQEQLQQQGGNIITSSAFNQKQTNQTEHPNLTIDAELT